MKINELKGIIEGYPKEDLQKLVIELYKSISKSVKDSNKIDEIVKNPADIKNIRKKNSPELKTKNILDIQKEVEQFIEYAYSQYYFAPNRYVSKKERSQWRFLVKRFYKEITAVSSDEKNLPIASEILTNLYEMLCYSCSYHIFNTYDSFETIGIDQPSFYHRVILLKYGFEEKKRFIKESLELILNNSLNRYTLYQNLIFEFLEFLKTPDLKELSIKMCMELSVQIKYENSDDLEKYDVKMKLNNLTEAVFYIYLQLTEYDEAIKYFEQNYLTKDEEVKLYIKLKLISDFSLNNLFIQQYEIALNGGIKPREELRKRYLSLKETVDLS